MDYTLEPYIVYVQTDEQGRITAVNSSAFVSTDWGRKLTADLAINITMLRVTIFQSLSISTMEFPDTS